jgi:ribosomal protein S17
MLTRHSEYQRNKSHGKEPEQQAPLEGIVVSDKMQKTRVVEVESMKKHSKYLKYYKVSRRSKRTMRRTSTR